MPEKPNIIIINCDDLGYGDLGCYGSEKHVTKAVDKMAEDGIRFTDFYMSAPVCSPSRASLLTGCYPKRIGFSKFAREKGEYSIVLFPGDRYGLNPDEITIAKLLKDQGYSTMLVGKWHCGDQPEFLPTKFGFDNYYGLPYSNDMGINYLGKEKIKHPWYDILTSFPPLPLIKNTEIIQQQPDQASLTERFVEEALRFIRSNKHKSFFLYLAHMYVHIPIYTPKSFLKKSKNDPYRAAVECIDWATDVIFNELKFCGIDDNTLVIFTSDNGGTSIMGGSNRPLRGFKGKCWEGGFRVPCIMRWPGKIKAGSVSDRIVTAMDLLPTIAKLAGTSIPDDRIIDGSNIESIIFDSPNSNYKEKPFFYYNGNNLYSVRNGDWKYFTHSVDYPEALYNLRDDISESIDLKDRYREIVKEMEKLLDKARYDMGDDLMSMRGKNTRPAGKVDNPRKLTNYDPNHPYIVAEYDMTCIIKRLKKTAKDS